MSLTLFSFVLFNFFPGSVKSYIGGIIRDLLKSTDNSFNFPLWQPVRTIAVNIISPSQYSLFHHVLWTIKHYFSISKEYLEQLNILGIIKRFSVFQT